MRTILLNAVAVRKADSKYMYYDKWDAHKLSNMQLNQ